MKVHYLELVVDDVNATCDLYAKLHKLTFSQPDSSLGNARTAKRADGSLIGIRAPMHSGERTVIRPYVLVEDIEAAVADAKQAGATIAVPPMKIPGHGTCSILIHNGIESGLWQL